MKGFNHGAHGDTAKTFREESAVLSVVRAVSPCALAADVPIVADPGVFVPEVVYCGGGTTEAMLRIGSVDLAALLEPTTLPIAARH